MHFVSRECPVCSSCKSISYTNALGEQICVREFQGPNSLVPKVVKCLECGMVYLNPIMTDEEYHKFYSNDMQKRFATSITKETPGQYASKVSRDDQRRARLVANYMSRGDRLLDVGTGNSNFIGSIDGAVGIDINGLRVNSARQRGLDVRLCDIFDWTECMDVVSVFHVLEHITSPIPFLRRVKDLLNAKGRLIVEVPNLNDALVGLEKYKNFYFQNAHCSYFTPDTLRLLLESGGFSIRKEIRLQRYSFDNHLYWLLKGKPGRLSRVKVINPVYSAIIKTFRKHDTIFFVCNKE